MRTLLLTVTGDISSYKFIKLYSIFKKIRKDKNSNNLKIITKNCLKYKNNELNKIVEKI